MHRIGQTREVKVHRLLMKDTIEERMLEMHQQKKMLFDATLSAEEKKTEQIRMFTRLVFGDKLENAA